jgi:hypothetical protein
MFGDPLDKQFSQSLLDAARKINDKTVADAKTAKEEKERLEAEEPQDMIGQFDEVLSQKQLDVMKKKLPRSKSAAELYDKMTPTVKKVEDNVAAHKERIAALEIMKKR